ncbi:hypothetical protein [Catenuloplanes atrovinosus]|uniref:Uncharacterized protein n=1 Tax=Catenuloplanes atrovinosus TaxID=137266 RepID=A0AAE3YLR3_9ACTN|nr:hypothetical protein [Catenuloplanes atrovinosus]MDR7274765.1 hypothetical protein [Catenuloplanes atrovinosus]
MDTTDALGMNMALNAMMRDVTSAQPGAPIRPDRPSRTPRAAGARRAIARALHTVADRVEPRTNPGTCATA